MPHFTNDFLGREVKVFINQLIFCISNYLTFKNQILFQLRGNFYYFQESYCESSSKEKIITRLDFFDIGFV